MQPHTLRAGAAAGRVVAARAQPAAARPAPAAAARGAAPAARVHGLQLRGLQSRLRARAAEVVEEEAEEDEYRPTVDIPLARVTKGKRVGQGSYGYVFEGELDGKPVILKQSKSASLNSRRFFRTEAAIARRLKGCPGVAPFLGVAGADVYMVWQAQGLTTLADVMGARALPLQQLAALWAGGDGAADDAPADVDVWAAFASRLLSALDAVHGEGVVHRDVKPSNILLQDDGRVTLLDLGAAADLQEGTNYSEDETVLDVLYGPPEQYLAYDGPVGGAGKLLWRVAWKKSSPDLFDSFSAGLILLQMAVPYVRSGERVKRMRAALERNGWDLDAWRDTLPGVAQADFEMVDEAGGAPWRLLCGMLAPRERRLSVGKALKDPLLKRGEKVAAKIVRARPPGARRARVGGGLLGQLFG